MAPLSRIAACLLALVFVAPALAEKRVALVIGNAAYKHAPALANPKNDAEGVAAALRRLKFDVSLGLDLDKAGMQAALRAFARKLDGATVALVFYAGHGLQVNGQNYVVPVDAKLEQESDLRWEAVSLGDLMQDMEQVQRTNIVILDACRDNPLARSLARSMGTRSTAIGRGLAPMQSGTGSMVVFATGPGTVALDSDGSRNSPFTAALLAQIETPGLEVRQVLTRVRVAVAQATSNKQVPWVTESLLGDFFFAAAAKPATPPATPSAPPPPTDNEGLFWQSIKDSSNIAHFKAYLARWPEGVFAALAKIKVEELEKAALRADEERKRKDDEAKKEIPAQIERARQSIKDARAALAAKRYSDAKRHAAAAKAASDQVTARDAASSEGQALARDVASLSKEVGDALNAHVRTQLARARQLVNASRFDEAKRILDEAAQLVDGAPEVAAARREYDVARVKSPTVRKPDVAAPDAPPPRGSPIAEIQRKAKAREKGVEFCATVPWPGRDQSRFDEFLGRPRGTYYTQKGAHGGTPGCFLYQITSIGIYQGRRCTRFTAWSCLSTQDCEVKYHSYARTEGENYWDPIPNSECK